MRLPIAQLDIKKRSPGWGGRWGQGIDGGGVGWLSGGRHFEAGEFDEVQDAIVVRVAAFTTGYAVGGGPGFQRR